MRDEVEKDQLRPSVHVKKEESHASGSLLRRRCFVVAGFSSIVMGILGIALPVLPTTPFMLLGAYCFARGSKKCLNWLLTHRVFGEYILAFRDRRGLTRKQKYRIALSVSLMMSISVFVGRDFRLSVFLGLLWGICMIVLFLSPTAKTALDLKTPSKPLRGIS